MAGLVFSNFARANVASPPSGTGGLAFTVEAGKGALFPNPGVGEYFYGAFTNAAKSAYEIVKITGRSGDSFTIDASGRGSDGTTAATWLANDVFYVPWTRAMLTEVPFSTAIIALAALSGSLAANKLAYFTSATAAALTDLTATGRAIIALAAGSVGQVIQYTGAGVAWANAGYSTGDYKHTLKTSETGWVLAAGGTIGDATSGATVRANADTEDLFTLLWNNLADAEAPVSGGRGANAAADFAVHKTITLPDLRGRTLAGKDDMGGSAASRVTFAISAVKGNTLGAAGGDERQQSHTHTGTTGGQSASHTHTIPAQDISDSGSGAPARWTSGGPSFSTGAASNDHTHSFTTASTGAGTAQNMPPVGICNVLIKL